MSNIRSIVPIQFYCRGKRTQASTKWGSFNLNGNIWNNIDNIISNSVKTNSGTDYMCLLSKRFEVVEKKISKKKTYLQTTIRFCAYSGIFKVNQTIWIHTKWRTTDTRVRKHFWALFVRNWGLNDFRCLLIYGLPLNVVPILLGRVVPNLIYIVIFCWRPFFDQYL